MTAVIDPDPDGGLPRQQAISAEIEAIESEYQRAGIEETQPRLGYAPYRSSLLRHPTKDLHHADPEASSCGRPAFPNATCIRLNRTSPSSTQANPSANG